MLRSAILPTIFALVLHGAVLGLLLHNWESPPPQVASIEPLYIAAKVVNMAPKPKQTAKPNLNRPRKSAKPSRKRYRFPSRPPQSLSQMSPQSLNIPRIQSMSWLKLRAMRSLQILSLIHI